MEPKHSPHREYLAQGRDGSPGKGVINFLMHLYDSRAREGSLGTVDVLITETLAQPMHLPCLLSLTCPRYLGEMFSGKQ